MKLSICLNLSVFYFEVINDASKAINIADQALQAAMEKIDDLGEEEFKDAKAIIELLKENLSIWKEEDGGGAATTNMVGQGLLGNIMLNQNN